MYGQQQDLAFPPRTQKQAISKIMTAPISESQTVQSYFKFANDIITFCQPITGTFYAGTFATIPLHPMLYYGRTANIALNFSNYQLTKAIIHYVPIVGTTSPGMIAIASTRNCQPITAIGPNQFVELTQINAQINPVWMCNRYQIPDLDTDLKMMAPVNRHDFANVAYVAGNQLAQVLSASCTIFIEMSIKLSRPAPSVSLATSPTILLLTVTLLGYQVNTICIGSVHGIIVASTANNIDIGEYVNLPPFPAANTVYPNLNLTHNDTPFNALNASDTGVMQIAYFLEY